MSAQSVTTNESTTTISPRLERLFEKLDPKRGRLIFALDATYSRQSTWDQAMHLQSQMFQAVADIGGLDVQLVYYRGRGECPASPWVSNARRLRSAMAGISCRAGHTQIRKVLDHVRKEHQKQPVDALIFVGDCCEELPSELYESTCSVPAFMFQEGDNEKAREVFAKIAELTGGAHVEFNANSAVTLAELLKAVAAFAAGGVKALADQNSNASRLLLTRIKK